MPFTRTIAASGIVRARSPIDAKAGVPAAACRGAEAARRRHRPRARAARRRPLHVRYERSFTGGRCRSASAACCGPSCSRSPARLDPSLPAGQASGESFLAVDRPGSDARHPLPLESITVSSGLRHACRSVRPAGAAAAPWRGGHPRLRARAGKARRQGPAARRPHGRGRRGPPAAQPAHQSGDDSTA